MDMYIEMVLGLMLVLVGDDRGHGIQDTSGDGLFPVRGRLDKCSDNPMHGRIDGWTD